MSDHLLSETGLGRERLHLRRVLCSMMGWLVTRSRNRVSVVLCMRAWLQSMIILLLSTPVQSRSPRWTSHSVCPQTHASASAKDQCYSAGSCRVTLSVISGTTMCRSTAPC